MYRQLMFAAMISALISLPNAAVRPASAAPTLQESNQKTVSSRKTVAQPAASTKSATAPKADNSTAAKKTFSVLKPMHETPATEVAAADETESLSAPPVQAETESSATDEERQNSANQINLQTKVTAPYKTVVKQPAHVTIDVQNDGAALTDPAILIVWLPKSVQLQNATPQPTAQENGSYEFLISELGGQATQTVNLDVIPQTFEPIQVRTQVQLLTGQQIDIRVSRPELAVDVTAPEFSFQNAEDLYTIEVQNTSPVELSQVRVVCDIPDGLHVTTLNRAAKVDERNRHLTWDIGRLGARQKELIQFKAIALQSGVQHCRVTAASAESEEAEVGISTTVDARPDLKIGLNSQGGPIQINQTATLELTVENRGTEAAKNVELEITSPTALKALATADYRVQGNKIIVPAADLQAGELMSIQLRFTGNEAGEHVVRAMIKSDSQRTVATEDTVFVYDANAPRTSSSKSRSQRNMK
jgi:hypothetical protein